MKLTKTQREELRLKYGGVCAYCGNPLGDRWHADHLLPIRREWWKENGGMASPENDRLENLMPACAPCNIDKHAFDLEGWRRKLEQSCRVLAENHATYRHAVRFGLLKESAPRVVFFFERAENLMEAKP